jgi:fluoride exporter
MKRAYPLTDYCWVALGSGLGGLARYFIAAGFESADSAAAFPFATLAINTGGCWLIGIAAGASASGLAWSRSPQAQLLIMTGLCGGFTTYSLFSWQTIAMVLSGRWAAASVYMVLSTALCLAAVLAGYRLLRRKL